MGQGGGPGSDGVAGLSCRVEGSRTPADDKSRRSARSLGRGGVGTQAEVAQPSRLRRVKGPVEPAAVLAFAAAIDWELLPLTARHAVARLAQPPEHKDRFDEWLLVQAQEEDMRLLTRDARLADHPFAVAGAQD